MKAARPQVLAENIVVIDGFSRAGKSLFAPLLSSLERGEPWQLNHLYEYLCALEASGRVTRDAQASRVPRLLPERPTGANRIDPI